MHAQVWHVAHELRERAGEPPAAIVARRVKTRRGALRSEPARAAWLSIAFLLLAAAGGCDGGGERRANAPEEPRAQRAGASQEYRVARTLRAFIVAFTQGDAEAACRRLTGERRAEMVERARRERSLPRRGPASCERVIGLQMGATSEEELDRLARSKVSKVALARAMGTAEVLTPARRGRPESHTVYVRRVGRAWKLGSDFFPGELRDGKVPRPPPPPPRRPAEERRVAAVFERFRDFLEDGKGDRACDLRTPAARRATVSQAVAAAGGRRRALKDYGELTCAAMSAGLRVPDERVRKITVTSSGAQLTLVGGATYAFKRLGGRWRVDA